jgi:hypothetical protein
MWLNFGKGNVIDGGKQRAAGSATKLVVGIIYEAFMLYEICFRTFDSINCRRNSDGYNAFSPTRGS